MGLGAGGAAVVGGEVSEVLTKSAAASRDDFHEASGSLQDMVQALQSTWVEFE